MLYDIRADKYEWEPCRVVGWDPEQRSFNVNLEGGGGVKSKMVKRLNLRFKVGGCACGWA